MNPKHEQIKVLLVLDRNIYRRARVAALNTDQTIGEFVEKALKDLLFIVEKAYTHKEVE